MKPRLVWLVLFISLLLSSFLVVDDLRLRRQITPFDQLQAANLELISVVEKICDRAGGRFSLLPRPMCNIPRGSESSDESKIY